MLDSQVNKESPRFSTTKWTIVLKARDQSDDSRQESWNDLVNCYWYPLYAFARRRGSSHQDAQDLTQGFFTHLLSSSGLNSVSPVKGRFRTFLLVAFRNFITNQFRAANALTRGGQHSIQSLQSDNMATRFANSAASEMTAEQIFERSWVESLLLRVRDRLAESYEEAGKMELFELLEPHLMKTSKQILNRAQIGERLGMSQAALAMSLHRMRQRYGEILRHEVSLTVDDPSEVDDEIKKLMSIVSQDSWRPYTS